MAQLLDAVDHAVENGISFWQRDSTPIERVRMAVMKSVKWIVHVENFEETFMDSICVGSMTKRMPCVCFTVIWRVPV